MARVLSFLIRYFSNYYTLLRSDLAARAAPLDPRLLRLGLNRAKKSLLIYFKTDVALIIIDFFLTGIRLKVLDII